jgi:hypothetical protein
VPYDVIFTVALAHKKSPNVTPFVTFRTPLGTVKSEFKGRDVQEYFDAGSGDEDWNPRYNIAPTQPVATFAATVDSARTSADYCRSKEPPVIGEQMANMLDSFPMAGRPDREKADMLNEADLKELRHNLAHLSLEAVRDLYERTYLVCGYEVCEAGGTPNQIKNLDLAGSGTASASKSPSLLGDEVRNRASMSVIAMLRQPSND